MAWKKKGKKKAVPVSKAIKKEIKKEIKAHDKKELELKVYDQQFTAATVALGGTVFPLTLLAQGLDAFNRVGNYIDLKRLHLSLRCQNDNTTYQESQVRILIISDNHQEGVLPTVASILTLTIGDGVTTQYNNNTENKDRYTIIFDKVMTFPSMNTSALATPTTAVTRTPIEGSVKFHQFNKNFKSHRIEFIGPTAVQAAQGSKNLYLVSIGNSRDGTKLPAIDFTWKLEFTDA